MPQQRSGAGGLRPGRRWVLLAVPQRRLPPALWPTHGISSGEQQSLFSKSKVDSIRFDHKLLPDRPAWPVDVEGHQIWELGLDAGADRLFDIRLFDIRNKNVRYN